MSAVKLPFFIQFFTEYWFIVFRLILQSKRAFKINPSVVYRRDIRIKNMFKNNENTNILKTIDCLVVK